MNEKTLRMYAELTQEVSLCQDEDIKELGKGILELAKNYDKALQEAERLNNIIKEAKEYIKENSIYYPTSDGCQWVDQFKVLEILDKGEEIKDIPGFENTIEELNKALDFRGSDKGE